MRNLRERPRNHFSRSALDTAATTSFSVGKPWTMLFSATTLPSTATSYCPRRPTFNSASSSSSCLSAAAARAALGLYPQELQ